MGAEAEENVAENSVGEGSTNSVGKGGPMEPFAERL